MRPQSAIPTAKDTKMIARENSPTQTAMRSSFYSMSLLTQSEKTELEAKDDSKQISIHFKNEQERRGAVVEQLNITNILELSQRDHEVLTQIKNFMASQETELQQEIAVMQKLMIEQAT